LVFECLIKAIKDSKKKITPSKLKKLATKLLSETIPESADILLKEMKSKTSKTLMCGRKEVKF
jgi:hypothetical protein